MLRDARPWDVGASVRWWRFGASDPTWARDGDTLWHAHRTPDGPVSWRLVPGEGAVRVDAWGPGAAWVVARAAPLTGYHDDPSAFVFDHPRLRALASGVPGLRLATRPDVVDALLGTVLQQRVTWEEAVGSWRRLVEAYGAPAPGPVPLRLGPDPARLAAIPYEAYHAHGVERSRALVLGRVAALAPRIAQWADAGPVSLVPRLGAVPGIGPWTLGVLLTQHLGAPDVAPTGDFHLPNTVAWALADRPRGTDAEMLALLAPFRPHRTRVLMLLMHGGVGAPKRAPRRRGGWVRGA